MLEWINHINKTYTNLTCPPIKVFKLDKTATTVDTLYGEARHSRIYLSPFEIKAFHFVNPFTQLLGYEALKEEEDSMKFQVNFEDMVQKIRKLRNRKISKMYIEYEGVGIPSIRKTNNEFELKVNGDTMVVYDLTQSHCNTVLKLGSYINSLVDDFTVTLEGDNDSSVNLVNFANSTFKNATLQVYSLDTTYDNITDIIEMGDLILSNTWRLYEVMNSSPSGNFAWSWVTWSLSCSLARMDKISLPSDYEEQIAQHAYGQEKIERE